MIEIDAKTAVTLYLFVSLGTLLGIWGYFHYKKRNKKLELSPKRLQVCEFCHCPYLEAVDDRVSLCPQCGLWNKK